MELAFPQPVLCLVGTVCQRPYVLLCTQLSLFASLLAHKGAFRTPILYILLNTRMLLLLPPHPQHTKKGALTWEPLACPSDGPWGHVSSGEGSPLRRGAGKWTVSIEGC